MDITKDTMENSVNLKVVENDVTNVLDENKTSKSIELNNANNVLKENKSQLRVTLLLVDKDEAEQNAIALRKLLEAA